MKPRFRRMVDGVLSTGEEADEEKMVDGVRDDVGGARESG